MTSVCGSLSRSAANDLEDKATTEPATTVSNQNGDEFFGWRTHYDAQRNLAFEFHTYTGEVRWLPPERVGFVMEGTRPLPAETSAASDDCGSQSALHATAPPPVYGSVGSAQENWSPFYPRMVMVPSGLVELQHQQPEISHWDPQLCSYNRFPVTLSFGAGVIARAEQDTALVQSTLQKSPGRRILPPTWEHSVRDRSPFLATHPVAMLARNSEHPEDPRDAQETAFEDKPVAPPRVEAAERCTIPAAPCPMGCTSRASASYNAGYNTGAHYGVWCYPQWTAGMAIPFWMQAPPMPVTQTHFFFPGLTPRGRKRYACVYRRAA